MELLTLEISLDFYLKDKSNDELRLEELRSWLAKTLYPQKHAHFKERSWRKYYDEWSKKVMRDRMLTKGRKTIYWCTANGSDQIRLYTKKIDNKKPLKTHCVRLEITLLRGGCQNLGVNRIFMLPKFVIDMRKTLSPYFSVAKYIKPSSKRASRSKDPIKLAIINKASASEDIKLRKYSDRYGVAWALKHDYPVQPDSEVNRFIGQGLKKLRENLSKLTWKDYKAEIVAKWEEMYLVKT